ncbi:MAG: AarF/UbiB family protein [Solirubrobacteraceae bacterium]
MSDEPASSRRRDAAARGAELLRGMRGLSGKLAQVRDVVPPALRDGDGGPPAPPDPLPWGEVRSILEAAWDDDAEAVLEEAGEAPAAIGSSGQVHRARLAGGGEVAVKVQRPGAEEAARADLQNVSAVARLASVFLPGIDPAALAAELRERTLEEFDYEFEAQAQRAAARAYRGHPFLAVPAAHTSLCTATVLVSDWVDGATLADLASAGQAERDAAGEMLVRFFLGGPHRTGRQHADPHPGNWRVRADGTLAVFDFGLTVARDPGRLAATGRLFDAGARRDADAAHAAASELGYLPDPTAVGPEELLEAARSVAAWVVEDRPVRIEPELLRTGGRALGARGGSAGTLLGRITLPAGDLMPRRAEAALAGVLAQLEPEANWRRISGEWWMGDPPATALGRAEAAFWRRRRR